VSRPIRAAAALLALILSVTGLALTSTPASATMSTLCVGYSRCADAGMGSAGYRTHSGTMWWRMYAGHNCTNYAAYRMVRSGLPNTRPWSGSGNASNWGHAMARITDATPMIGAVAWWDAYVRPAGSAGHVAYVEKVISDDEIIVSQDSWGGDFSWARITRSGGSWPSGFIHFNDVALTNTARPALSGTAKVGSVLTASAGRWSPSGATYSYTWLAGGVVIPDQTGPTLRLRRALEGKRVKVWVTATKDGYPSETARSERTAPVAPGVISNTALPVVSGVPKVDSTLTATSGSWSPSPTAVAYQWSAAGVPIDKATESTLTIGPDLVGKPVSVTVTASKAGYTDVARASAPTAAVAPGTFAADGEPVVTGLRRLGETLSFAPVNVTPADAGVSVQWLRGRRPIPGADGSTYQPTADDLGKRIRVRVTFTKPGYTTLALQSPATGRIKTVPRMRLSTDPRRGRLHVELSLAARGVDPVAGTVRITSHGEVLAELALRDGAVATTIRGLEAGRQRFVFRFLGSRSVTTVVKDREPLIR
jgi:surface antigen